VFWRPRFLNNTCLYTCMFIYSQAIAKTIPNSFAGHVKSFYVLMYLYLHTIGGLIYLLGALVEALFGNIIATLVSPEFIQCLYFHFKLSLLFFAMLKHVAQLNWQNNTITLFASNRIKTYRYFVNRVSIFLGTVERHTINEINILILLFCNITFWHIFLSTLQRPEKFQS